MSVKITGKQELCKDHKLWKAALLVAKTLISKQKWRRRKKDNTYEESYLDVVDRRSMIAGHGPCYGRMYSSGCLPGRQPVIE